MATCAESVSGIAKGIRIAKVIRIANAIKADNVVVLAKEARREIADAAEIAAWDALAGESNKQP